MSLKTTFHRLRRVWYDPCEAFLAARPPLSVLAQWELSRLPFFVQQCAVARKYLTMLGLLDWTGFPERDAARSWPGCEPLPLAAFAAAYLVKLDRHLPHIADLHTFLLEHPALVWVLGFPFTPASQDPWGFDVVASLPTHRHFSRLLRTVPNATFQFLLDRSVARIQTELAEAAPDFGQCIALDTKHILAWAQENNPKAYVKERYKKDKRLKGDPDARLGVKRRRNQRVSSQEPPPTPLDEPLPAGVISVAEYYWGYASGIVATKVPGWGEFVLAELTQPFDCAEVSYFFPLMEATERRLGFRPRYGAFDAAFDAWYVYEFFHRNDETGGFAAVPFAQRGGQRKTFDANGLPLCEAGLAMPLKYRFISRTELFPHEKGRHVCPLLFPEVSGASCPILHDNWPKGGCQTTMATSIGARLRYQLDREGEAYKTIYKQRSASERINAQAVALGIERPHLRNQASITNHNTLLYTLINLHALQRVRQRIA